MTRPMQELCPEATSLLCEKPTPKATKKMISDMTTPRQIQTAEIMLAVNNLTACFAKAMLLATPKGQLNQPGRRPPVEGMNWKQRKVMEREIDSLYAGLKSVGAGYRDNVYEYIVAKGYLARLLENDCVCEYLERHHMEVYEVLKSLLEEIPADIDL